MHTNRAPGSWKAAAPPQVQTNLPLRAVNGWRGPGALGIAVAHFLVAGNLLSHRVIAPVALLVDLFFVLSGLVLAHVYIDTLARPSAAPSYLLRRLGRIWPLHITMLFILVAYEAMKWGLQHFAGHRLATPAFGAGGSNSPMAIWTNLLLIQSLGIHNQETWNFPSWSLSVEFATYCLFALFCLAPRSLRRPLALAIVLSSITIIVYVAPAHMRSTHDFGVVRCLIGFFSGVLLCDILKSYSLPRWPLPTLVEAAAVALTLYWMWNYDETILVYSVPVIFCLLIVAFVPERGLISRLLVTPIMQLGVELSLGIYLVHGVVMMLLLAALRFITGDRSGTGLATHGAYAMVSLAIYVALVLIGSWLGYRYIERPARALFNGLAKRIEIRRREPAARGLETVRDA